MRIVDRREEARQALRQRIPLALAAMGREAQALTRARMEHGYARPVRDTGALERDVDFEVRAGDNAVDVGCSLPYAVAVHEGACNRPGRPFLRDALAGAGDQLARAVKEEFHDVF